MLYVPQYEQGLCTGGITTVGEGCNVGAGTAAGVVDSGVAGLSGGEASEMFAGVVAMGVELEVLAGIVTAGVMLEFVAGGRGVGIAGAVMLAAGVELRLVGGDKGMGAAVSPVVVVAGAAPVYQGARPMVCKYSIFGQTMVSQPGGFTRPPVSPAFAFQANQKKLVMGL